MDTKKQIAQGVCPKCSSNRLEYGVSEMLDSGIRYPYICLDCKFIGNEYYELTFSGHTDETDPNGEFLE